MIFQQKLAVGLIVLFLFSALPIPGQDTLEMVEAMPEATLNSQPFSWNGRIFHPDPSIAEPAARPDAPGASSSSLLSVEALAKPPSIPSPDGAALTRSIPIPAAAKEPRTMKRFSTFALGFKANTLGAGVELATPISRSFNLRAGVNLFTFAYPFNIDGIDYNADLHFRSGQVSLDWFPEHGGFHVSPGLVYLQNNLSAIAGVPPGQYFELGSQGFTNSVDDPFNGTATVVYPRRIAPMLMLGFSNILPRNGKHFSMPYEFGVVYTGDARVDVKLNGTACTYEGCFDVAKNPEAQKSLQEEIDKLNHSLKSFPVYPIISLGLAYRF